MIKNISDLNIKDKDTENIINVKLNMKLGITTIDMTEALVLNVKEKSEEIAKEIKTIVPFWNYSDLIEDLSPIEEFIFNEASKPLHWDLLHIEPVGDPLNPESLNFIFSCFIIDDGKSLIGYVNVSLSGKIMHAFAQCEN